MVETFLFATEVVIQLANLIYKLLKGIETAKKNALDSEGEVGRADANRLSHF